MWVLAHSSLVGEKGSIAELVSTIFFFFFFFGLLVDVMFKLTLFLSFQHVLRAVYDLHFAQSNCLAINLHNGIATFLP